MVGRKIGSSKLLSQVNFDLDFDLRRGTVAGGGHLTTTATTATGDRTEVTD